MVGGDMCWADPFDDGEAYVNRGAPEMLGMAGLAMMMLNYVLFGLAVVIFGKAMINRTPWLELIAKSFARPWSYGVKGVWQNQRHALDMPLMIAILVAWIFLCQFFNEMGLGVLAMIGLALMAVVFLRMLKE